MVNNLSKSEMMEERAGSIISQCESISILIQFIWAILIVGIMAFNTFKKIELRNKFFKGLLRRNNFRFNRTNTNLRHRNKQTEETDNLNLSMGQEDHALGSMGEMGILPSH